MNLSQSQIESMLRVTNQTFEALDFIEPAHMFSQCCQSVLELVKTFEIDRKVPAQEIMDHLVARNLVDKPSALFIATVLQILTARYRGLRLKGGA